MSSKVNNLKIIKKFYELNGNNEAHKLLFNCLYNKYGKNLRYQKVSNGVALTLNNDELKFLGLYIDQYKNNYES